MKTPIKKIGKIPEGGETFPLAESLARELGDVPEGTPVTMAMFQRVLFRLADLRSGRVQKPNKMVSVLSAGCEQAQNFDRSTIDLHSQGL